MDNDANDESHFFDDLVLTGLCTGESDAIGVCGGTCASDADSDGICDDSEDQCTDTSAANYDDPANGDCQFQIFYEPFTDDSQFTKNAAFSHDGGDDYWGIYDPVVIAENKVMAIKNNPIIRDQKIFNSIILPLDRKIQNK